jgi:hypothetical protein
MLAEVLNEAECPVPEEQLAPYGTPGAVDTVAIASALSMERRADLARFCYNRTHLLELALRIAASCDLRTLEKAFGRAGPLVYDQSRDIDATLAEINKAAFHERKQVISLAGPARSQDTED